MTPGKTHVDVALITPLFAVPAAYAIKHGWYLVAVVLAVAGLAVVKHLPDIRRRLA